jgi:hypothetical protein
VWGGPGGAAALFDYLADAALAGDARAAGEVARLRARLVEQLSLDAGPAREADYPNAWPDAYFGNHCADAQYPRSFPTWLAIDRYARLGSRFGPFWWWGAAGCARWPLSPDRYAGPWRARTSAPVLVVGNYFDGITAYDDAVATDRLLRNSRLLSYAGWGHTAYSRSECVTRRVDAYLLRGALPPRGTVCRANPNPFLTVPGRQAAQEALLVGLPPAGLLRR